MSVKSDRSQIKIMTKEGQKFIQRELVDQSAFHNNVYTIGYSDQVTLSQRRPNTQTYMNKRIQNHSVFKSINKGEIMSSVPFSRGTAASTTYNEAPKPPKGKIISALADLEHQQAKVQSMQNQRAKSGENFGQIHSIHSNSNALHRMMVNKKDPADEQINVPLFARKNVRSQMGTRTRINRLVA